MKTKRTDSPKDERVVVRVSKPDSDWLKRAANKEDCSVGRIIRQAIRCYKTKAEQGSFNQPELQLAGFSE